MRIFRSRSFALATGLSAALAFSMPAIQASAASTFLLQFGQHQTDADARAQWDELQKAHAPILEGLELRVAEIRMGGGAVYRTQASAMDSRADAQAVCSELADAGSETECLVVETSMYEPMEAEAEVEEVMMAEGTELLSLEPASTEEMEMAEEAAMVAAAEPATKSSSFREALLPWLSNGPEADEAEEETEEVAPEPVPVEPVEAENVPAPEPVKLKEEVPSDNADRSLLSSLSDRFNTIVSDAPESAEFEPTEPQTVDTAAGKMVVARAPKNLATETATEVAPVPQTAPVEAAPEVAMAEAEVEVAEAIRVPVSFGNAVPVPTNKPVGYGGFPSQPLPQQSLWVQVSHFAGKEAAMSYWRELSYQQPELTRLLRVRIVTPWKSRTRRAQPNASLRLGPFASQDQINALCNIASQRQLRCTMVSEVGSTGTASTTRQRPTAADRYSRQHAINRGYNRGGSAGRGMYWVQLGAFDQVAGAQARWEELQAVHHDVLGRMQPQVSYPALSSSPQPVYHLRTGPFVSRPAADNLCGQLQNRHLGCVVIQSR